MIGLGPETATAVQGVRVATENLIRVGAQLMIGQSRNATMGFLGIVGTRLASLLRLRESRDADAPFLRQQLIVLKRSEPGPVGMSPSRTAR